MRKVQFLTPKNDTFESLYLLAREKEGRVYSDDFVRNLPVVPTSHPQHKEWKLREHTLTRFLQYLEKKSFKNVLDLGCGNGWFTNKIALEIKANVTGLDVNELELEQANRLFSSERTQFIYGDVFQLQNVSYDLITINAAFQYFTDGNVLIEHLKNLLSPNGELHVLDTPFYNSERELLAAEKRTFDYYNSIQAAPMADMYFHHTLALLKDFKIMYQPPTSKLKKLFSADFSPFGWYYYQKI